MNIIILGGDGFCGWPNALHLSNSGHNVLIIDNLSRRNIDNELECSSLTPIKPIGERIKVWKEHTGNEISFINLNVAKEYDKLLKIISEFKTNTIIHFAEQRAAPYSMKSSVHKRYTIDNNISATNNVLAAIVESGLDIHLIHLGTMGVYGYSSVGLTIPEGYLKAKFDKDTGEEVEQEILYPSNPGSVYHTSKVLDQHLFAFYAKNDQIRITDLHQGIVWGTQTEETRVDEKLINRFDYDGDYGTVLNRFLVQAAIGYPLTVHGVGGQTRAFIHIEDTVKCIEIAVNSPPELGNRVQVFNQMTETHKVIDLAKLISKKTGVDIQYLDNPRKEDAENDLKVANEQFLNLGLNPISLDEGLFDEVINIAGKYKENIDADKIPCVSKWVK